MKLCDGGTPYRGSLGVALDGASFRTVNYLDIEDYVLSVVPMEMSAGWADQGGAEALRAQAIAALAYGTETIPAVDKITGPGNAYVAAAKRQVFGRVGIDSIAGPSEVLVIADGAQHPDWLALDLLAQAEHDADAQAILMTPDPALSMAVVAARVPVLELAQAPAPAVGTPVASR